MSLGPITPMHLVVLFQGVRFVPSCGIGGRAVGVLCTGVGVLRTTFPKRPLCSKKCFSAYFIKYTEYRPENCTGRAWLGLYPESADDLHLVISKTCCLQNVPILGGGRLRQAPLRLVFAGLKLDHRNVAPLAPCSHEVYEEVYNDGMKSISHLFNQELK